MYIYRYAADAADASDPLEKDQVGYAEKTYQRLREVKGKYDQINLFKNNMNVSPLGQQDQAVIFLRTGPRGLP